MVKDALVAAAALTSAVLLAWWLSMGLPPPSSPATTVVSDAGRGARGGDAGADSDPDLIDTGSGTARGQALPEREAGQARAVAEIEPEPDPGRASGNVPGSVAASPPLTPVAVEPSGLDTPLTLPDIAPPAPPVPAIAERAVVVERNLPSPEPPTRAADAPSAVELPAVQTVVRRYEQTYKQLDVKAVAAIWPSVDTRSLSRMFERIQRQDLRFDTCAYAVSDARATATCAGSLTYVPRVGGSTPRTDRHTWSIQLERAGQQWQIMSVSAH